MRIRIAKISVLALTIAFLSVGYPHAAEKKFRNVENSKTELHMANFKDGIIFSNPDYPPFIKSAKGFSVRETWGRWSDGKNVAVTFKHPLPKKFKLEIKGTVLPSNAGKPIRVEVGKWSGHIKMTAEPLDKAKLYEITVLNTSMANEIRITVPNPEPPGNGDPRNLGIGFVSLKIVPEK